MGLLPENELSPEAGVDLSPVTGGPVVGESLQTNVEGIFSCGNVLHVHDLVDYVSEESASAGRGAARYIKGKRYLPGGVEIKPGRGVRYTVPASVHPDNVEGEMHIRFRVDNVYRGSAVAVYVDGAALRRKKALILSPGEMETITLKREVFDSCPGAKSITIAVEGA